MCSKDGLILSYVHWKIAHKYPRARTMKYTYILYIYDNAHARRKGGGAYRPISVDKTPRSFSARPDESGPAHCV